ncbi:hypothetical protein J6590_055750 [Homalodisca vitripennis]|nr:hypothetical protein J6590_055750 [Homalodisca vitripennis]
MEMVGRFSGGPDDASSFIFLRPTGQLGTQENCTFSAAVISDVHNSIGLQREEASENNNVGPGELKYRRIFREYKLKFHKPKKDQCMKCIAHEEQKHDADYDDSLYIEHCERKEAARKIRDKDKEDAKEQQNVLAIQSDLQAVLNTPKGASGPFFYIPRIYHGFYNNLPSEDSVRDGLPEPDESQESGTD